MNNPIYDLDELSITWQRIVSCSKGELSNALYKGVTDKLSSNMVKYLEGYEYDIDELSKSYQRIASVSGSDHKLSKLLLSKISEQL
ncbi:hypothetical protein NVP1193O_105 [Vibrio phage 1.193.O._10N.286.52.C6]|nr:hypothetical protein NVP1193O_105 [Vibrio phage 1.193.O._10N.286.52.C6]